MYRFQGGGYRFHPMYGHQGTYGFQPMYGSREMYGFQGNPFYRDYRKRVAEMARQGAIGIEDLIRNKVRRMRHWKLTSLGKKRPKWGFEFTVMTYNILSQKAADCHPYLYRKCNPQFLSEEYRISRIIPEILRSQSDVVCLQEVEQHLYDYSIKKVFDSNGFGSIFKKRTGNKSDGCAILWRRAKFSLLHHKEVEFRTRGCEYLNRDNVGIIAVLRPRHPQASHTQLHVATTHLLFNPRRGDIKLCQLRVLLAELEQSAFKGMYRDGRAYHPTVLCGDFNLEPYSPLYRFIESGRLDVMGLVSGNMSGQYEGRDKGGVLDRDKLSLDGLGIDESGRFSAGKPSSNSKASVQNNSAGCSHKSESSNESRLESYRRLRNMMHSTQLQSKDFATENSSSSTDNSSEWGSSDSSDESPRLFYHDFNFVPAYKHYHQDRRNCPVTMMVSNEFNTVDHIFYNALQKSSTSYTEDVLKLLSVYTLLVPDELKEIEGLPNAHLGSDHLSLMSKFLISFRH